MEGWSGTRRSFLNFVRRTWSTPLARSTSARLSRNASPERRPVLASRPTSVYSVSSRSDDVFLVVVRAAASRRANSASSRIRAGGIARDRGNARGSRRSVLASKMARYSENRRIIAWRCARTLGVTLHPRTKIAASSPVIGPGCARSLTNCPKERSARHAQRHRGQECGAAERVAAGKTGAPRPLRVPQRRTGAPDDGLDAPDKQCGRAQ